MRVIIVLPFRGDAALLRWTLEGYAAQECPGIAVEVRVGGDGVAVPKGLVANRAGVQVVTQSLARMGAGAVRNALLRTAEADVVIFGNADARPEPDMVRRHVERLTALPAGSMVLGAAPWETSATGETVFDALLAETPMVFFYQGLSAGEFYDFRHAWTLNLSVRLEDFRKSGGFIEEIRPVYYEDLAWGHRLLGDRRGIYYDPAARVLHRHPTTLDQYLNREELLGLMAPVLAQHAPAVFAALFGPKSVSDLAADYRHWTTMDAPMHKFIYQRLAEWAALPMQELPTTEVRQRTLLTIYQMHIPLKRLAFRLGFLRGIELIDDVHWLKRQSAGLWKRIVPS